MSLRIQRILAATRALGREDALNPGLRPSQLERSRLLGPIERPVATCNNVCNAESSEGFTFSIVISPTDRQGPFGEKPCLFGCPGFVGSQSNLGNAEEQPNPEGRETVAPAKLNEKDVDSFAGVFLPESDVSHLLNFLRRVSVDCYHTENHELSDQANAWERKLSHE